MSFPRAQFSNRLALVPQPNGHDWRLAEQFMFLSRTGTVVTAPVGFITDLASIPPVAWIGGALITLGLLGNFLTHWTNLLLCAGLLCVFLAPMLKPSGRYTAAAVLHDWIYRTHAFPRWHADYLFVEMMAVTGVPRWQRWLLFVNVRAFGWIAWRNQRRWRSRRPSFRP